MELAVLLNIHTSLAGLVLLIYIVRGGMMLANSNKTNSRSILSITSIFTLLLFGLGVYLAFILNHSFADGYVLSKIIGLLLFVGFGVIALKHGLSKVVASILWLIGLLAFVYTFLLSIRVLEPLF